MDRGYAYKENGDSRRWDPVRSSLPNAQVSKLPHAPASWWVTNRQPPAKRSGIASRGDHNPLPTAARIG